MEEIFKAFGVDGRLIVIQIFNFALLVVVLWYFLYKPVLKILSERQEKIEKGVRDAENASKRLDEADNEKSAILSEANVRAKEMVEEARLHADEKGGEIVADAAHRSERLLLDAKEKSDELRAEALRESEAEIAKLAVLAAEKVLREKT